MKTLEIIRDTLKSWKMENSGEKKRGGCTPNSERKLGGVLLKEKVGNFCAFFPFFLLDVRATKKKGSKGKRKRENEEKQTSRLQGMNLTKKFSYLLKSLKLSQNTGERGS